MKGTLIKMVEGYTLSLTNDIDDLYAISNSELATEHELYKLNIKNCESVELGYDLDELSLNMRLKYEPQIKLNKSLVHGIESSLHFQVGVVKGFKKAIELIDTNKYYEFIRDCAKNYDCDLNAHKYNTTCRSCDAKSLLKSLSKDRWDVEIVMETPVATYGHSGWHKQPKLDKEKCLILKRL